MAASSLKRKSAVDDAYQDHDDVRTPTGSPSRKKMRISRKQKQALMDNLQLEITERARRLRAQYALQTHDLRARIDRRVNRIPVSLRKANMGELLEKHQALLRSQASPRKITSPTKNSKNVANIHEKAQSQSQSHTAAAGNRRVKKPSHEGVYSDKENAVAAGGESAEALSNPKKRGKAAGGGGASRMVSQEMRGGDSRILSPKSQNSRTYPQSPFRGFAERSQQSGYLSKPVSPLKPSSPLRANSSVNSGTSATTSSKHASQTGRPGSRTGTAAKGTRSPLPRPATRQVERRNSISSNASSGTTVVRPTKTGTGARKATTTTTTSSSSTAAKKPAAARNQAPANNVKKTATSTTAAAAAAAAGKRAPTPTGDAGRNRTLRKRA